MLLSRRAIAADLDALADAWQWAPDDVLVDGLPLFHVHGLVLGLLGSPRVGNRFVHTGKPTLINHVAQQLSVHKRPREVRVVNALPRNAMGKILKKELMTLSASSVRVCTLERAHVVGLGEHKAATSATQIGTTPAAMLMESATRPTTRVHLLAYSAARLTAW